MNYTLVSLRFCFQEDHRAIPSESQFQLNKGKESLWNQPLTKDKLCLTNLTALSKEMTGSVDVGKAMDVM